jgi:hypothetical protein
MFRLRGWILAAAILGAAATPAGAAADWEEYVYDEFGVAKEFPLPPERSEVPYAGPETSRFDARTAAANRTATRFQSTYDDIIYRMDIVDISDALDWSANVLGECSYLAEQAGEVESSVPLFITIRGRVGAFGRLSSVDLFEDKGRLLTACFYSDGRLYRVEAHILPENGNWGSPFAYRYMAAIRFAPFEAEEGGTE